MRRVLIGILVIVFLLAAMPGIDGFGAFSAKAETPRVVKIAAGHSHSLALFSDGTLYAWGDNNFGQLGDGTQTDRHTPVFIGEGFTAIAAGNYHSLALKGSALYAWGLNNHGQLGDGSTTDGHTPTLIGSGYTAIAAGQYHTLALKSLHLGTEQSRAVG